MSRGANVIGLDAPVVKPDPSGLQRKLYDTAGGTDPGPRSRFERTQEIARPTKLPSTRANDRCPRKDLPALGRGRSAVHGAVGLHDRQYRGAGDGGKPAGYSALPE